VHRQRNDPIRKAEDGTGDPFFLGSDNHDEGMRERFPVLGLTPQGQGKNAIPPLFEEKKGLGHVSHPYQGKSEQGSRGRFGTGCRERGDAALGKEDTLDSRGIAGSEKSPQVSRILHAVDRDKRRGVLRETVEICPEFPESDRLEGCIDPLVDDVSGHPVERHSRNKIDRDGVLARPLKNLTPSGIGSRIVLQVKTRDLTRVVPQEFEYGMETPNSVGGL
jgi:hypothetical protein